MKSLYCEGKVVKEHTPKIEDRSIYILVSICQVNTSYRGGMSVHVCTLLYTHVYTTVYTRVHKCALSISSLGLACMSTPWG